MLFEPGTYIIQSRHNNLVAFNFELALMLKVLKSVSGQDGGSLEVKLTRRAVPTAEPGERRPPPATRRKLPAASAMSAHRDVR